MSAPADVHLGLLLGSDRAPLLARPYYAGGDPGPIVAALAHVPELLEVAMPFLGAALGPSAIDRRTKEIVVVRTSALAGCRYCVRTHSVVALDAGLTRAQVTALRTAAPVTDAFADARELALIDWVDRVANLTPVPDDARRAVRAHFADHEVVELTMLVGATLMLNRFATALTLPTGAETASRLTAEGLT